MFGIPLGWIVAGVDIALIVHAARTGRFTPWGFVILFLPGIGALAYVVVETGSRVARLDRRAPRRPQRHRHARS